MKMIGSTFRFGMGPFLAGLVMLVTLGGCIEIRVASNLGDCPTVSTGDKDDVPGACNPMNWPNGDAAGFLNVETGQVITTTGTHTCNTGIQKKCAGNPGKCGFRGPSCLTKFYPNAPGSTSGQCNCACP